MDGAPTVGVIGLGAMGAPMARNLLTSGLDVVVAARRPEVVATLVAAGARPAGSVAELAGASDVLLTVLPDAPDTEAVLLAPEVAERFAPGTVVVDSSTCAPAAARALAAAFAQRGVAYLDAPVSGGVGGAAAGTLTVMVGGDVAALERARPVLDAVGSLTTHLGPVGAGQVAKACNQLLVAGTVELVAEALLVARRSGVDPALVRQALLGGMAGSRILDVHGERMLARSFDPGFRNRLQLKDARIVAGLADEVGVPLPAFAGALAQLEQTVAAEEWADLDHAAMLLALEAAAG
ncbi:MAG: NAD(P)-dependent oxidoreductase [Acidimicrobiia bacterium]